MFLWNTARNILINQIKTNKTLIKTVHTKSVTDYINLNINGDKLTYPAVWLRENCQCELCFHPTAKSRTLDWSSFNINVTAKNVEETANEIKVEWDDGHKSIYKINWLRYRSFKAEDQKKYTETIYKPNRITWSGDDFTQVFTKHKYEDILSSDQTFYNWLNDLSVYGVALIQNTPDCELASDKIIEKIGFRKQTHYGVKFTVQNVPNTSNVAYLSNNLPVHVDLPYYEYCPGVNMLHCLVQTHSEGGENLLSDGHFVANYMKQNHYDYYKMLVETEVEWADIGTEHGNEFFKLHRQPVICLDKHGNISRINFSVPQRGSYFPGKLEDVKPWYEAHGLFFELNHKFSAKFKTHPGEILVFDNIRLLHGRNGYKDKNNNVRKLIGSYIDWDEIYSRLRCLKVKLEQLDGIY